MPVTATRTLSITASNAGTASSWIPLDIHSTPFNVGFGIDKIGTGDVTFRVEHTFDNVLDPAVSASVFTHPDVSAATQKIDGNYAFGVRACRLKTASASGSSTLVFTLIQAGI